MLPAPEKQREICVPALTTNPTDYKIFQAIGKLLTNW